jgi:hypothetical protein
VTEYTHILVRSWVVKGMMNKVWEGHVVGIVSVQLGLSIDSDLTCLEVEILS